MSALPARDYEPFDDPVEPAAAPRGPVRQRRDRRRRLPGESAPLREGESAPPRERRTARPGHEQRPAPDADTKPARKRTPPADRPVDPPPLPVTAPRAPFVMLVLILVAAGIVGLLVVNTEINENSFRLKGLRDRQAELDAREQQLRSALAEKQSPGNLAAAATRLGLVPAGSPAFLHLPDGRVFGVPQPGGARNGSGR